MKVVLLLALFGCVYALRPLVLLHGLLATAPAMSHCEKWAKEDFPGIYIHNVELFGPNATRWETLFTNINKQVDIFAEIVKADKNLSVGFNCIGHSQGGLITRGYVERYAGRDGYPVVHNLISWAGPQDGVYGVPGLNAYCPDDVCGELNHLFDAFLNNPKYAFQLQDEFTFAAYWKDIFNYADYQKNNRFLADVNNEKTTTNTSYFKAMTNLTNYLLIEASLDGIVVPKTSPWFQFYAIDDDRRTVPFLQSIQYTKDLIGLKTLMDSKRLHFGSVPCGHQDVPRDVCKNYTWPLTKPFVAN